MSSSFGAALEALERDDLASAEAVIAAAERELGGVDDLTRASLLAMASPSIRAELRERLARAPWPDGKPSPVL